MRRHHAALEINAAEFMEVFNNTISSLKLYQLQVGPVCDRHVQLKGRVIEAYLRQAIKIYAEVAGKLVEDEPR